MQTIKRLAILVAATCAWSSAQAQITVEAEPLPASAKPAAAPQAPRIASSNATNAPKFKVTSSFRKNEELGQQQITVLKIEGFDISYMAPNGCARAIDNAKQKVTYTSLDSVTALSIRIIPGLSANSDQEFFVQRIKADYPTNCTFSDAVPAGSGVGSGLSADLKRPSKSGVLLHIRHTVFPFAGGEIEMIYTSDSDHFDKDRSLLTILLNSIKADKAALLE